MLGGGGIGEHEASAVSGGGGMAEREDSAVSGGGGIAEREDSAVFGGGGIAEQDDSAVFGGGGMADPVREVLGGGGIAEHDCAVLGGGGMNDPERTGRGAPALTSSLLWPVSSAENSVDRVALAPNSIQLIVRLIRPATLVLCRLRPPAPVPGGAHQISQVQRSRSRCRRTGRSSR
jgi:hypothetical protein